MRLRAVLLISPLTACGADAEPPTFDAVVADIGCTGAEQSDGQMFARETGPCELNGETIYLATFADADNMDQWLEVAPAGGGIFVAGDLFAVQALDQSTADAVAEATGGKVQ